MNNQKFRVLDYPPTVRDFLRLRREVGWDEIEEAVAKSSLESSLYHVTVYEGSALIGMGRIVGDGAMYFYLQDVMVSPAYQGKGVGGLLMERIEEHLKGCAVKGSTIGLLAAAGKESFYARYGYLERTGSYLGLGMCKFI